MSQGLAYRTPRLVLAIGLVWLALALAVSASGRLATLQPPRPQLVLLGLTAAVILAGLRVPSLRAWVRVVDPRAVVALHLTRFVGADFLVLYERGELPYAFAVPGGWGDIAVATLALGLLLWDPPDSGARHSAYRVWNLFGLLDIVFVVATAARLALHDPASMQALLRLPLSLLPTFLVPLIIATHLLLAVRLSGPPRGERLV